MAPTPVTSTNGDFWAPAGRLPCYPCSVGWGCVLADSGAQETPKHSKNIVRSVSLTRMLEMVTRSLHRPPGLLDGKGWPTYCYMVA